MTETYFAAGDVVRVKHGVDDTWDGKPGRLYDIDLACIEDSEREDLDDPPYYIVSGINTGDIGVAIPHYAVEKVEGPVARPHYAEFVVVRRIILQTDASGEAELLEQMQEYAKEGSCTGMSIADESPITLIHEPYGSLEVGPQDGGASWFGGDVWGTSKSWMKELGERLIAMSEEED